MPIDEALFWFGITAFGTGLFVLFEAEVKRWQSIALMVAGALACAYAEYRHYQLKTPAVHLWVVLLALTWAMLAYLFYLWRFGKKLAKTNSSNGSPQTAEELRATVVQLAGDLCAFLLKHNKAIDPPPVDDGFAGLGPLPPEDLVITSDFSDCFDVRVVGIRKLLGERGLLAERVDYFSSVGETLRRKVGNAEDVRAAIRALDVAKGAIDVKFLHGKSFLEQEATPPAISTAQDALFSPLQVDIFRLAKELREFIDKAEPYPEKAAYGYKGDRVPDDAKNIHAYHEAKQAVDARLVFGYQRQFSSRVRDVLLRAGEANYPLFDPDWGEHVRDKDGFRKMAADLEMTALWFSHNRHALAAGEVKDK